jgi:hypothetical protein
VNEIQVCQDKNHTATAHNRVENVAKLIIEVQAKHEKFSINIELKAI